MRRRRILGVVCMGRLILEGMRMRRNFRRVWDIRGRIWCKPTTQQKTKPSATNTSSLPASPPPNHNNYSRSGWRPRNPASILSSRAIMTMILWQRVKILTRILSLQGFLLPRIGGGPLKSRLWYRNCLLRVFSTIKTAKPCPDPCLCLSLRQP